MNDDDWKEWPVDTFVPIGEATLRALRNLGVEIKPERSDTGKPEPAYHNQKKNGGR